VEDEEPADREGVAGDVPVAGNSYTDGDYNQQAFVIDEKGVLTQYRSFYGDASAVVIPDGVTAIGDRAFSWCEGVTSVTIPGGVTRVGEYAFENCTGLKRLTIPGSVTRIGAWSFRDCKGLEAVVIHSKKITINADAFDEDECDVNPHFSVISASGAGRWARKYHFKYVVDDLPENGFLLLENTTHSVELGTALQIVLDDGQAKSYASSDKAVATVSSKGLVKPRKAGTAKITVTLKGGAKRVLTLKVVDPAKLSADKLVIASIDTAAVRKIDITGLAGRDVTWTTSNKKVAAIKKGTSKYVKIQPGKKGTATIKAELDGGRTLKCTVKVVDPVTIEFLGFDENHYAQLAFNNHSSKKVTRVQYACRQYNKRGKLLNKADKADYILDEEVKPYTKYFLFLYVLEATRSVKVSVTEVIFSDGTRWMP